MLITNKRWNKLINGREETDLPHRIPNNLCRYPAFKEVGHNSPLLKRGLCIVTFPKSAVWKESEWGRVSGEARHTHFSQVVRVNISSANWTAWALTWRGEKGTSPPWPPFQNTTPVQSWENIRQIPREGCSAKHLTSNLKTIKVVKAKASLRHCPEEPKETRRLSVRWDPGWKKDVRLESRGIWINCGTSGHSLPVHLH